MPSRTSPRKSKLRPPVNLLTVGIGIAIALCAWLVYRLTTRTESLQHAAMRAMQAVESKDARLIMRYLRKDEAEILELNESKLKAFLEDFLWTSYSGFSPITPYNFERFDFISGVNVSRTYQHPDGRQATILLTLAMSEEGPKLLHATSDLLFSGLCAHWPQGQKPPWSRGIVLNTSALRQALPLLEKLPLQAVAQPMDDGQLRTQQWADLLHEFEAKVRFLSEAHR
jgi:hypothetical protein